MVMGKLRKGSESNLIKNKIDEIMNEDDLEIEVPRKSSIEGEASKTEIKEKEMINEIKEVEEILEVNEEAQQSNVVIKQQQPNNNDPKKWATQGSRELKIQSDNYKSVEKALKQDKKQQNEKSQRLLAIENKMPTIN